MAPNVTNTGGALLNHFEKVILRGIIQVLYNYEVPGGYNKLETLKNIVVVSRLLQLSTNTVINTYQHLHNYQPTLHHNLSNNTITILYNQYHLSTLYHNLCKKT